MLFGAKEAWKMATATGNEWELARRWLLDARVIPPNHPVTKPTAQLIDFANCLRDGVFLCALLNKLIPKSVAHYHPRASLQVSDGFLSNRCPSSLHEYFVTTWTCSTKLFT